MVLRNKLLIFIAALVVFLTLCGKCFGDPELNQDYELLMIQANIKQEQKVFKLMEIIHSIRPNTPVSTAFSISKSVIKYSTVFNIPIGVYICIMKRESEFVPDADENMGAGLMQIVPRYHSYLMWAHSFKRKDLYDIDNNILIGSHILKNGSERYDSIWGGVYLFSGGNSWYANNVIYCSKTINCN
jgi:Soluble lytic murein transglycosylase and related regulatory proteins (some contain LysM/invasin domains)